MSDVSMLGCGRMGSGMVAALRDAGSEVTAWNRTRRKAEVLAGPRVEVSVRDAAEDAQRPIEYFESVGLDAGIFRALKRLFEAGVEEGRGEHDVSCVAELQVSRPE